jgi:methylmalonyl-CoA mutase N-terminal domain/subunit
VLGGTQSLHTNSLDETYALPTEEAVTVALRTQQIILHESGVANVVDPLAGSYHVEWLTDRLEKEALTLIERIDSLGGMVRAVEQGYPQREIARSAYEFEQRLTSGQRTVVGVNAYRSEEDRAIPTLRVDPARAQKKIEELVALKANRSEPAVRAGLDQIRRAAKDGSNLMPPVIAAARALCSEQEICDVLRAEFGSYTDPAEF